MRVGFRDSQSNIIISYCNLEPFSQVCHLDKQKVNQAPALLQVQKARQEHQQVIPSAPTIRIKNVVMLMMILIVKDLLKYLQEFHLRLQLQWILKNLLSKFKCTKNSKKNIRDKRIEINLRRQVKKLVNI